MEEAYMDERLEDFDGRLDAVYGEVSSIKTDTVKMMRRMLERTYGKGA